MPPETDNTLQIRINLNTNTGESRTATKQIVEKTMFDMKRLIIDQIAILMSKKQEGRLKQNLRSNFVKIVEKELSRMGRQITSLAVGLANNSAFSKTPNRGKTGPKYFSAAAGPPGTLAISGATSLAMQGQTGPVSLVSGTGPWPARNPKYLADSKKAGRGTKWFKQRGDLARALRQPSTYFEAYGPVSVAYKATSKAGPAPVGTLISKIGTGAPGRKAKTVIFGQVQVGVLGRITSGMLNDPGQRQPSPWNTGLFSSLDQRVEEKLLNRQEFYRPFLEHFLSYYLTRAIPNAIFRRLEQVIKSDKQVALNLDL